MDGHLVNRMWRNGLRNEAAGRKGEEEEREKLCPGLEHFSQDCLLYLNST